MGTSTALTLTLVQTPMAVCFVFWPAGPLRLLLLPAAVGCSDRSGELLDRTETSTSRTISAMCSDMTARLARSWTFLHQVCQCHRTCRLGLTAISMSAMASATQSVYSTGQLVRPWGSS